MRKAIFVLYLDVEKLFFLLNIWYIYYDIYTIYLAINNRTIELLREIRVKAGTRVISPTIRATVRITGVSNPGKNTGLVIADSQRY